MKKTFLLFLCVFLGFLGCKKDDDINLGYPGTGTARIYGTEWNGRAGVFKQKKSFCDPDTCIYIIIGNIVDSTQFTTRIFFDFIPLKRGKFSLNPSAYTPEEPFKEALYYFAYHESITDGDIELSIADYEVAKGDTSSFLEITDFDKKTGEIEGRFEVTAIEALYPSQQGKIPDTIRISDGWFTSKIECNR